MNYQSLEFYRNMDQEDKPKYNGRTLQHIQNNMPPMNGNHRTQYLRNVERVIECQVTGSNLHEIESRKNENHRIVKLYL